MKYSILKIATRKSPLALWQANYVGDLIRKKYPGVEIELVKMSTQGDKILDSPLAKVGGKGLFVKELEQGILDGRADIAVHSMKDVPVELPSGLHLSAILKRHDPRDALVSNKFATLSDLPARCRIGTSSLRRRCQISEIFPMAEIVDLRGNVNTRLNKLDAGRYDAIILAVAGLERLGFEVRIKQRMSFDQSLPAIGQGAIGVECRTDDMEVNQLTAGLNDSETLVCVQSERAMNESLQGGCQVPIAGYAELDRNGELLLKGLVGKPDGSEIIRGDVRGPRSDAKKLGQQLAEELYSQGAGRILKELEL